PRAIGMKRAMDMILTGRAVSAAEGLRLGFVSEVVPDADLPAAAQRWAAQIAACAPIAIRASKQITYGAADQPDLAAALDFTKYDMVQVVLDSEDALEGKRAFAERRKPKWTGR
ncbi:MAG: enoyl-CoA hydratase-related protein, partial [Caulobacterales bacterium]